MSSTYLDSPEDLEWLTDVHEVPAGMGCAILYGNEDSPTKIVAWKERNPHWQSEPDYYWAES